MIFRLAMMPERYIERGPRGRPVPADLSPDSWTLFEWGLVSRYRENLRALMKAGFRDTTP
jgi:hypothetical protein